MLVSAARQRLLRRPRSRFARGSSALALLAVLFALPNAGEAAEPKSKTTVPKTTVPKTSVPEVALKATIDVRDEWRITPRGCEWIHRDGAVPTNVVLNGAAWDTQKQPKISFNDPAKFLPAGIKFANPEVSVLKGRGRVSLRNESPQSVVVQFYDVDKFAADYEVVVRFRNLPWLLTGTPQTPKANARDVFSGDVRVTATIEGDDELQIYRDRAEWVHRAGGWPSSVKINGRDWEPEKNQRLANEGKTEFIPDWAMFAGASHWVLGGRGRVYFFIRPDHLAPQFFDNENGSGVYDVVVHQGENFNREVIAEADKRKLVQLVGNGDPVPHPTERGIPTERERTEWTGKWEQSRFIASYDKHSRRDPRWDAPARAYLEHLFTNPLDVSPAVIAAGDELGNLGCDDPLICLQHGNRLQGTAQYSRAEAYFLHAVLAFEKSTYPWQTRRHAPALLARLSLYFGNERSDQAYALLQRAVEETSKALAEPLEKEEKRVFLANLRNDLSQGGVLRDQEPALLQKIGANPKADPWIKHLLLAGYLYRQGWQGRGDGMADTVTQEGWQVFHSCLEQARAHLVSAWRAHPEFPEAAVEMIMVNRAVAGVERETPRFWFDQAVAAQIDAPRAHSMLRWAIRPRWGGSHEEMLQLGLECLRTRRFDTCVPDVFSDIVCDIKEENGDFGALIAELKADKEIRQGLVDSEKECPAEMRQARLTRHLLALYYLGLRDLAQERFVTLRGDVDAKVLAERGVDARVIRFEFENPPRTVGAAPLAAPLSPLFESPSPVDFFAVSADGAHMAVGGTDPENRLTVWNVEKQEMQKFPVDNKLMFAGLQFSPDSQRVAGLQIDTVPNPTGRPWSGSLSVWKLKDQTRRELLRPGVVGATAFSWMADDNHLVVAQDQNAAIYDVESARVVAYTPRSRILTRGVAVSNSDRTMAVGYANGLIKIFRIPPAAQWAATKEPLTLEQSGELDKHVGWVDQLLYSPDGQTLVSLSQVDQSVLIWDVAAKALRYRLGGSVMALSADGTKLATTGGALPRSEVVLWDLKTGTALLRCKTDEDRLLTALAFTSDGKNLLAAGGSDKLLVWAISGGK